MLIDCDTCRVRGDACRDYVISVLLATRAHTDSAPDGIPPPVDLDESEQQAVAVLASSGLVPPLRLVPVITLRAGGASGGRRPRPRRRRDIA
jgi:hypothetical protein